jgi:integrase
MPAQLPQRVRSALEGSESDYSSSTFQSYRAAWRDLLSWWSGSRDLDVWTTRLEKESARLIPFQAIASYLRDRKELAWSTLIVRRQAISLVYDHHDILSPFEEAEVQKTWAELRKQKREEKSASRSTGTAHRAAEVIENGLELLKNHSENRRDREDMREEELFRRDMQYLPQEVSSAEDLSPAQQDLVPEPGFEYKTIRNRALLLLIATTSATRTEIVGIRVEDIHLRNGGVSLQSESDKAKDAPLQVGLRDDEGNLESVLHLRREPQLRYCPARAVASWIIRGELEEGPLFRSLTPQGKLKDSGIQPQAINHAIRRRAEDVEGLDSDEWTTRRLRSR